MDRREELRTSIAAVLARHPSIAVAYVFGSVARGQAREDSDLDVGVVFERGAAHDEALLARLSTELAAATGVEPVDVIDLEAQGPIFAHGVLLDGFRVYVGSEARRVDFESETLARAFDFRPTYELATRGKVAALRRWLAERR